MHVVLQSLLDVAPNIVSDERLGEPRTNRELADLLERGAWISEDLARRVRNMVGFRNLLVHGYEVVDLRIVREVVDQRLGDLLEFVAAIRQKSSKSVE